MVGFPLYKRTDIHDTGYSTVSWHATRASALKEGKPRVDRKRDRDKRPNHITIIEIDTNPPEYVKRGMK